MRRPTLLSGVVIVLLGVGLAFLFHPGKKALSTYAHPQDADPQKVVGENDPQKKQTASTTALPPRMVDPGPASVPYSPPSAVDAMAALQFQSAPRGPHTARQLGQAVVMSQVSTLQKMVPEKCCPKSATGEPTCDTNDPEQMKVITDCATSVALQLIADQRAQLGIENNDTLH